jgi:putative transposase
LRQIYVAGFYGSGYSRFMKCDISDHPQRECIENRVEIIKFFEDYGAEATRRAFGKSRSTIYLWKQRLAKSEGRLSALAPGNKAPRHKRRRIVHPFIEGFIIEYRTQHPGVDKTTITPSLTEGCIRNGVAPVSESTVGRIIHDLKRRGRLPSSNRVTVDGRTGNLRVREPKPKKKIRRKGFLPRLPGDLVQMDTIAIFTSGLKRYIFTAIDVSTRFAFAYTYASNSSSHGNDFLGKFLKVAPFVTRRVQTDNGGEFASHFDHHCQESGLTHFFNYPRHPQSNACLERFNRTIQEQFARPYELYLDELAVFNARLMEYLIWYNTEKPHRGIGNRPPLCYFLENFISPEKSNMLWTLTPP